MKLNRNDLNKSGIYCIRNTVNQKVYIGKSKNIYNRIIQHIYGLNKKLPDENRHLIAAWHKYGSDAFEYFVVEYIDIYEESIFRERELYWIDTYNSIDRLKGYNLRRDSATNMIVHEETRQLFSEKYKGENNPNYGNKWSIEQKKQLSEKIKKQFQNGRTISIEQCKKGVQARNELWLTNPELKEQMKDKVRKATTKYKIEQYDKKTFEFIKSWDCINDILVANPTYKKHNIYAVCSGEKKSMYGYIWVKVLIDDIVQTDSKVSEGCAIP